MLRKILTLTAMLAFVLALMTGCGQKAEQEANKVPAEVKTAEMADSTRMDSAAAQMADSAAAATETMEDEAAGH